MASARSLKTTDVCFGPKCRPRPAHISCTVRHPQPALATDYRCHIQLRLGNTVDAKGCPALCAVMHGVCAVDDAAQLSRSVLWRAL
jgi:hypothetical protein